MKAALFIDGGYLRSVANRAEKDYVPDFIEAFAWSCFDHGAEERPLRVLYYDCDPFMGEVRLPVSRELREYPKSGEWLNVLAARPLFAVRRGVLKFRGFRPRGVPDSHRPLTDDDFAPVFEQKGVDMRLGLDMAHYATSQAVDRAILVSRDTDCLPALKYARRYGCQVVLIELPGQKLPRELLWHVDLVRPVGWPNASDAVRRGSPPSSPGSRRRG